MRPVIVADIVCAARAVMDVAPVARAAVVKTLLDRADAADRLRRSTGRVHSEFGDGTLAAAARIMGMAKEPGVCHARYAQALITVLQAVAARPEPD